jgi:lipopolysaccharide transport system permease protein
MARIIITPPRRFSMPDFGELWAAREVMLRFGQRDIILRYRQTALGVIWVVLQPLLSAGIFAVVFGRVAGLSSGGVPYFVFSLAGMLAWNLFSNIVSRASGSIVGNQSLVSKVFFPRILVPLSSAISALLDFAVGFVMFLAVLVIQGVNPGWPILLTPVWALALVVLSSGIGVVMAALTVTYRDVTYIVPWILQIGLYATPIAYTLSSVPSSLHWLFVANPLTWYLESFRWSLLGTAAPPAWQIVGVFVSATVVLLGGTLVFQRFERGFADVI